MNDTVETRAAARATADLNKTAARIEAKLEAKRRVRALRQRAWLKMNPDRMPGQ